MRRLRERQGWTQEELAERAEMSATYLGFLEPWDNVPPLTIIIKLAKALRSIPAELIEQAWRNR